MNLSKHKVSDEQLERAIQAALQDNPGLQRDPEPLEFRGAQARLTTLHGPQGQTILLKCPDLDSIVNWALEGRATRLIGQPEDTIARDFSDGSGANAPYLLREFYKGATAKKALQRFWQRNFHANKDTVYPLAGAIGYDLFKVLRETILQGIVHRDIKPANIIFTTQGEAKIVDWGLAADQEQLIEEYGRNKEKEKGARITQGNIAYMSPEQMQGAKNQRGTDLYSVGLILFDFWSPARYHAAQGKRPKEVLKSRFKEEKELLKSKLANAPQELAKIIQACTHRNGAVRLRACEPYLNEPEKILEALNDSPFTSNSFLEQGRNALSWYARVCSRG